jgi:predicted ATP-grasp superfamily ATP-dependent carboligase
VLVAGFATRHVAQSAFRAGYEVYAVDHFCDQDLAWYTKGREKFEDLEELPDAIARICTQRTFDIFVVTSGAEEIPTTLPLYGTPKESVARFLDKLDIQHFFEAHNVPVPRIAAADGYPYLVKPRRGAGGWRNAVIQSAGDLSAWEKLYPGVPFIRQEFISGVPASACCVTDGSRALVVAVNEQILRGNGSAAFGFCGSLTPFDHPLRQQMTAIAERAAAASGCRGTVGIDFVISDDACHAIEINPRFQGTVDTVEMATGCSLFEYHVNACQGRLPPGLPAPVRFAARSILFADHDLVIKDDLKKLHPVVADIPWPGTFFEKDQAVVSVYGWGATRKGALAVLDKHISTVRQYMR